MLMRLAAARVNPAAATTMMRIANQCISSSQPRKGGLGVCSWHGGKTVAQALYEEILPSSRWTRRSPRSTTRLS